MTAPTTADPENAPPDSIPRERARSRRRGPLVETVSIGLLLLGLLLVFFHDALRPGTILAPADEAFTTPYFHPQRPAGWTHPANPLLFDQVYLFIPWRWEIWQALRQGRLPLWDPDSFCGTPLAGTMQAAVFYPPTWIAALLPFAAGFVAGAIARLWIAGMGAYGLARRYGLGRTASLTAAVAFMFCGFNIVWLGFPLGNVAVWLPAMILAADHLLGAPTLGRGRRALVALALIVGVQWTGGHGETSVDLILTLGLYCLLKGIVELRPVGVSRPGAAWSEWVSRIVLRPLLAAALGSLLAAPAILTFLEWMPLSHEFQTRAHWPFEWFRPFYQTRLMALPLLVTPDFWSNPLWGETGNSPSVPGNYNETILYLGIVPLMLAVGAFAGWSRRRGRPMPRWAVVWSFLGAFAFGRAFQLPVFDWLNQAPLLSLGNPTRIRVVFTLMLCLMAGVGMQELTDEGRARGRIAGRRWPALAVVLGLLSAALAIWSRVPQTKLFIPSQVLAAVILFILAGRRGWLAPLPLAGLLLLAALVDLFAFGVGYNPTIGMAHFFPRNPVSAPIERDTGLFRTTSLDWTTIPNHHVMLGQSDVRGMDFQTEWFDRYLGLTGEEQDWMPHGMVLRGAASPLLRVLNLKYVLTDRPERVRALDDFQWSPDSGGVRLGRATRVQPRSFMVHEAIRARDDAEAARLLAEDPARIYRRVVLCNAPEATEPIMVPGDAEAGLSEVVALEYTPERSVWRVRTSRPGWLVTTDAFYPGWRAFLDDRPVTIHRANLAFRAVHIPAGEHRLVQSYRPWTVRLGAALSALALAILAGLAVCLRRESAPV